LKRTGLLLATLALLIFLVSLAISRRDGIASWLVNLVGEQAFSMWAISFFITLPERTLLFVPCCIALGAGLFFAGLLRSSLLQFLLPVLTALALFLALYFIFPQSYSLVVALSPPLAVAIIRLPHFVRNARSRDGQAKRFDRPIGWLACVILVPAMGTLLLDGWSLVGLARRLHAEKAVQQLTGEDLNGLAVDTEQGLLFASGHGSNYILAYNLRALDQPPRRSQVEVGAAENFFYNPLHREIYVVNEESRALLVLDATQLALKKSIPVPDVAPGDYWVMWDQHTDSIIITAETGDRGGFPFLVSNRATGELVYSLKHCDGEVCTPYRILLHPSKPLLYMGFKKKKLLAYDTQLRQVVASAEVGDRWMDGIALTPSLDELLVGAPVSSAVLRFDAATLKPKGRIATVFGVRSLAVDPVRNLLFTASLLRNKLDVIDLKTMSRVAQYHVGPWLRAIALDTDAGIAYVSSNEGLYKVNYTAGP